jgi:propanol-preferring alcohol dehydrogenase
MNRRGAAPLSMRAMVLERVGPIADRDEPLAARRLPVPQPPAGHVRLRVLACGVCHTELDEIEGRTPPPRLPIVPGHEVVGRVDALGAGVQRHRLGDRVGVGWIHASSGADDENLAPEFRATGRDADGGYAEYMTAPERYAHPIPATFADAEAAPLLCAGAVGYRALRLTGLVEGAGLGLTGFGASAHLVLQLTRHLHPQSKVAVFARDRTARDFALALGADWAGEAGARAPFPLRAIIDTTPAWRPVVEALANLVPGGRLVINAIRKEEADKEALLDLSYPDHLWLEREIKTVANVTGRDVAELLALAARIPIRPVVTTYALEDANRALQELRCGGGVGAKVLVP